MVVYRSILLNTLHQRCIDNKFTVALVLILQLPKYTIWDFLFLRAFRSSCHLWIYDVEQSRLEERKIKDEHCEKQPTAVLL